MSRAQHIGKNCPKCGRFMGENGHECPDVAVGELGPTQTTVLELLEELGECRADDLNERMDLSLPQIRATLRRLRKRDMVISRPNPDPRCRNGKLHRLASQENPDRLGVF